MAYLYGQCIQGYRIHTENRTNKKAAPIGAAFALLGKTELVLSLDVVHANLNGLHVQWDELVGALW